MISRVLANDTVVGHALFGDTTLPGSRFGCRFYPAVSNLDRSVVKEHLQVARNLQLLMKIVTQP